MQSIRFNFGISVKKLKQSSSFSDFHKGPAGILLIILERVLHYELHSLYGVRVSFSMQFHEGINFLV